MGAAAQSNDACGTEAGYNLWASIGEQGSDMPDTMTSGALTLNS